MKILSIESCNGLCSAALMVDNKIIAFEQEHEACTQAERLFLLVEKVLLQHRLSYDELDALAVNVGPGSFTGIRIGVAAAKGVRIAAGVRLIGVNAFEALAYSIVCMEDIIVVLDARREQIYLQHFMPRVSGGEELKKVSEPMLYSHIQLKNYLNGLSRKYFLIGNAYKYFNDESGREVENIDAAMIANAASIIQKNNKNHDMVEPLYIRDADVTLPKK